MTNVNSATSTATMAQTPPLASTSAEAPDAEKEALVATLKQTKAAASRTEQDLDAIDQQRAKVSQLYADLAAGQIDAEEFMVRFNKIHLDGQFGKKNQPHKPPKQSNPHVDATPKPVASQPGETGSQETKSPKDSFAARNAAIINNF